jgi:hypothetical protein
MQLVTILPDAPDGVFEPSRSLVIGGPPGPPPAFRMRAAARKVNYCPFSAIVHLEGMSLGKDVMSGVKANQIANTKKLYERWHETLSKEQFSPGVEITRTRSKPRSQDSIGRRPPYSAARSGRRLSDCACDYRMPATCRRRALSLARGNRGGKIRVSAGGHHHPNTRTTISAMARARRKITRSCLSPDSPIRQTWPRPCGCRARS